MTTLRTLADFKRAAVPGAKFRTIYHRKFAGRDEKGETIYQDEDKGTRTVSIQQTNAIAFKTTKADGTQVDSWLYWPKAKECQFNPEAGTVEVFEEDRDGKRYKILTYSLSN